MTSHVVIPDPHAKHNISNERFEWGGKLVVDRQPDVVVCLGDLFDMESLSSYDRGKKDFEGRRYWKDIEAGVDALKRFNAPIEQYNENAKKSKKAQYKPRKVFLIGNHEVRVKRATQMHPELDGTISFNDFELKEHGWEVVDFLSPIAIDGIYYSHYFVSGVKGESISGQNIASALLQKNMLSSTAGHNHTFDFAIKSAPDGRKRMGLCAGCFLAKEQKEEYAAATEFMWWRGVMIKNNVHDGEYDLETMEIDRLKELYG